MDAVFLPGGFSYGDYLRCGAIARFSPVIRSVRNFARSGGLVIGVCNGFQILCETGLLEGALIRNRGPAVHLPDRGRGARNLEFAVHFQLQNRPTAENPDRAWRRLLYRG